MLACPFCGSPETDRFDLEGRRFVVFACQFTPAVDPKLDEPELARRLATDFRPDGAGTYFRGVCDRLHLYVTTGAGGQRLIARAKPEPAEPPA